LFWPQNTTFLKKESILAGGFWGRARRNTLGDFEGFEGVYFLKKDLRFLGSDVCPGVFSDLCFFFYKTRHGGVYD
jgi:hypothetical protein